MNYSQFVETKDMKPWCPHIHHGTLKPAGKTWHYSKGWHIKTKRSYRKVGLGWVYCPLCGKKSAEKLVCPSCAKPL